MYNQNDENLEKIYFDDSYLPKNTQQIVNDCI